MPRLRQEGELTFGAPPDRHGSPHGERRSRQDEVGFEAFLTTYESAYFWPPYSSSSIPSRNQRKRPSLKGVTS